MLKFKI